MFGMRKYYKQYRRFPRPSNPRIQNIQILAKNPVLFYQGIFAPGSQHINSYERILELVQHTPEYIRVSGKFHRHLGIALVDLLKAKVTDKPEEHFGKKYYHNSAYPSIIKYCSQYIDEDAKDKIIDIAINYNKNFYSTAKKELACIVTGYVKYNDPRTLSILREFCRVITINDFDRLINKIQYGLENQGVKEILSKTKLFEYLKYDEETVNNSYNEKVKLVKAIAKTPTLIKRLPFILNIKLRHLKEIAPAMRFKFIQYAFKYEFQHTRNGRLYGKSLEYCIAQVKRRLKENKLVIEEISVKDMKELLFSICLQKNDEFVKWINDYEAYLACKHSTIRVDVGKYRR